MRAFANDEILQIVTFYQDLYRLPNTGTEIHNFENQKCDPIRQNKKNCVQGNPTLPKCIGET